MIGRAFLSVALVSFWAVAGNAQTQLNINTTSPLPAAIEGAPYSQALAAAGGAIPYAWSLDRGGLPPGVVLNADGSIGGTPSAPGSFAFTVKVSDSGGLTATKDFAITTISAAAVPKITTEPALPEGIVGIIYSQTLAATGGTAPYTWTAANQKLPPGLTLNETTGILSGTPTAQGTFQFTVGVKDSTGIQGKKDFSINFKATSSDWVL